MLKNKIIFISGWAADDNIWKKITEKINCEYIILPWEKCLGSTSENNELHKVLIETDRKYILAGWSLGGLIALDAAITFGKKIEKLIMISSTSRMTEDNGYTGTDKRLLRSMKLRLSKMKEKVLKDFFSSAFKPEKNDRMNDFLNQAEKYNVDSLKHGLEYLEKTDLREKLSNIKCPLHLFHGKQDQIMKYENSIYLSEKIDNAELEIIPDAGHMIPLFYPELIFKQTCK